MAGWRLARALEQLRSQVNAAVPNRAKGNDGTIGDAKHAASKSEHNPNASNVVTAMDITHDPKHGFDSYAFAEHLRTVRDPRVWYVISNGRIWNAVTSPFVWRPYAGANKHDEHVHISLMQSAQFWDDTKPWNLGIGTGAMPSADPKAPAAIDRPVIRIGSKAKAAVSDLQGLLGITVDGKFGKATEKAVRAFQAKAGLAEDGIVGGYTWRALLK